MRPPTHSLTRAQLADLLRDEAPTVAARLADTSAPRPRVRSFLHPLLSEGDRVRLRLAAHGLVELRDAIDAGEADDATLLALSRVLSREASVVALRDVARARGLLDAVGDLLDLARSSAWVHCDPEVIAATHARTARALADAATTTATTTASGET